MANEIIYVCNSTNNKNVREGELNILEKHETGLYFEFGENSMNTKKRYYNDLKTLNKDFDALLKLKEKAEKEVEENKEEVIAVIEPEEITADMIDESLVREQNITDGETIVKVQNKKGYRRKDLF